MQAHILFVDDDPDILDAIRHQLRKTFQVTTTLGGGKGLDLIQVESPFAVIIADMRNQDQQGPDSPTYRIWNRWWNTEHYTRQDYE